MSQKVKLFKPSSKGVPAILIEEIFDWFEVPIVIEDMRYDHLGHFVKLGSRLFHKAYVLHKDGMILFPKNYQINTGINDLRNLVLPNQTKSIHFVTSNNLKYFTQTIKTIIKELPQCNKITFEGETKEEDISKCLMELNKTIYEKGKQTKDIDYQIKESVTDLLKMPSNVHQYVNPTLKDHREDEMRTEFFKKRKVYMDRLWQLQYQKVCGRLKSTWKFWSLRREQTGRMFKHVVTYVKVKEQDLGSLIGNREKIESKLGKKSLHFYKQRTKSVPYFYNSCAFIALTNILMRVQDFNFEQIKKRLDKPANDSSWSEKKVKMEKWRAMMLYYIVMLRVTLSSSYKFNICTTSSLFQELIMTSRLMLRGYSLPISAGLTDDQYNGLLRELVSSFCDVGLFSGVLNTVHGQKTTDWQNVGTFDKRKGELVAITVNSKKHIFSVTRVERHTWEIHNFCIKTKLPFHNTFKSSDLRQRLSYFKQKKDFENFSYHFASYVGNEFSHIDDFGSSLYLPIVEPDPDTIEYFQYPFKKMKLKPTKFGPLFGWKCD